VTEARLGKPTCTTCGASFEADDLAVFGEHSVCAACQPAFVQAYRQGTVPAAQFPTEFHYAGFWIRAAAQTIDTLIVIAFQMVLGFVAGLAALVLGIPTPLPPSMLWSIEAISVVADLCYFSYFWTRSGATPGKMVFGLKVISENGGPVRTGQAIKRWFSQFLSGVFLGYGFMKAGWSPQKRSLHDGIARTRVIYSR
jgi:uncharacterized RDD family membrane protein YckC